MGFESLPRSLTNALCGAGRDRFYAFDAFADRLDGGTGYDDGWADQRDTWRSVEGMR